MTTDSLAKRSRSKLRSWLQGLVPTSRSSGRILQLLSAWAEQSTDYALILTDENGIVLGISNGTQQVLGYAPSDLVGRPMGSIFTPEDLERGLDAHERRIALSVGFAEADRWHLRKDRTRIWAGGTLRVLRDKRGACIGFAKVLRDRSDLRMLISTLENRVAQLAEADRRKLVFLSRLAHELANPLQPLSNAVSMLAHRDASPHDKRLFAVISRQIDLLRRLVRDVHDLSAIESGKFQLATRKLSLQQALMDAADAARDNAVAHGVALELLMPPADIELVADPVRLQQIVANLLANAIKYTPRGGHVWLKADTEEPNAVIRVEDDGIGIAPDMLPRLFELFTQETRARPLCEGGIGMGLALVKELVEQHQGTVEVRSEGKGKGSHFAVRLPLA